MCLEPCGCNNAEPRAVGFVTNDKPDEICKVGCYCCDYALIQPRILYGVAAQVLCFRDACSLPCHPDYLNEPLCAYYCLSCYPECGCAVAPPKSPALQRMVRGSSVIPQASVIEERGNGKTEYAPIAVKSSNEMELV